MSVSARTSSVLRARSGARLPNSLQYARFPPSLLPRRTQVSFTPVNHISSSSNPSLLPPSSVQPLLQSQFLPQSLRSPQSLTARPFHTQSSLSQQQRPNEDIRDPPRQDDATTNADSAKADDGADTGDKQEQKTEDTEEDANKDEKKKDTPPPPPHGDKSPWQVFTDTLTSEFKASKEWNEGTKALASSAHDFTQNPALQRVYKGYGVASDAASSSTAKVLKNTGKAVGQGAAWTWDTLPVKGLRVGVGATGRGLEKATRPLRETEAFKSMANVIDDGSSSRYGGWVEKEERRKKREAREAKETGSNGSSRKTEKMEEDIEAGTNVTLHKDAAWKESWRAFRDDSKVMQGLFSLKSSYNESENPLISTARSISDRVAGFFAENETATVIKKFREMDPSFQLEAFLQDMRDYMLPEILDAYVKGDIETLKLWLSEAQYQVYAALMKQYTNVGLKSDGRILDIRNVDVLNARMIEPGEIPVFILTCRTQEVHVYRNSKTGDLAAGMEDRVQQVTYAIGITRIPEDVMNRETRGWRLIELQKTARDFI